MNTLEFPKGFNLLKSINLSEDKKIWFSLNSGFIVITIVGLLIGHQLFPDVINLEILTFKNFPFFIIGHAVMIIVHELIHGLFIKITSGFKVNFGLTLSYAYAGNKDAYFNKKSYLAIALSPFILIGLALQIALVLLPATYFWLFYLLQIFNFGGALGDFYVAYLTLKMPDDVLVNDHGTKMNFYSKKI